MLKKIRKLIDITVDYKICFKIFTQTKLTEKHELLREFGHVIWLIHGLKISELLTRIKNVSIIKFIQII